MDKKLNDINQYKVSLTPNKALEKLESNLVDLSNLIDGIKYVKNEKNTDDEKVTIYKNIIQGYITALHDLNILDISLFCEYCDRLQALMDKYWDKKISHTIKSHKSTRREVMKFLEKVLNES